MAEGRPTGDRADPHAVRAHGHGPARPALRRARLPGRRAELPRDVRVRVASSSRCATSRPTGAPPSNGSRRQPWFDGRLVMWGASYLGMTQWAVAQDAPDFVRALSLQVTAANFRDSVVFPGGAFALETALAWLHEITHQELGWRTVLRARLRGARAVVDRERRPAHREVRRRRRRRARGLLSRTGSSTAPRVTRGGTPVDFGRRLEKVPPASFIGGWYDLFLKAQVDDYEALRRAGRTARLTIGPWTHTSPGLFAETVRDGPRWFDEPARPGRERRRRAGAPLRHGVAHLAGVLAVAAGGGDRAVVSRTGWDADPEPHRAHEARPRQRPDRTTTTRTTRHRP